MPSQPKCLLLAAISGAELGQQVGRVCESGRPMDFSDWEKCFLGTKIIDKFA